MKLSEIDVHNITDELIRDVLFNVPAFSYDSADVLIVFGCHIKSLLDERLNAALEILNNKTIGTVILSGGVGEKGDFDESDYMLSFLKNHGVTNNIILENKSINSEENVINCIDILRNNNLLDKDIVLVSNEFHIRKLAMMFKRLSESINLIYEYPNVSTFSYDAIISNPTLRGIAVDQIIKIKNYAINGLINDEEMSNFSGVRKI